MASSRWCWFVTELSNPGLVTHSFSNLLLQLWFLYVLSPMRPMQWVPFPLFPVLYPAPMFSQLHWYHPVLQLTFLLISFALLCAHFSSFCLSFMASDHDDFLASLWLSRSCTHVPKSQSWLNPALPSPHLQLWRWMKLEEDTWSHCLTFILLIFKLKYSWFTKLYQFQVYCIGMEYFYRLYCI